MIFLLVLLPIQASWAAACAYCPDDCVTESVAGTSALESFGTDTAVDADDDCSGCKLGGVGMATSLAASRISPPPLKLALDRGIAFANSSEPDRPERPNWMRAI